MISEDVLKYRKGFFIREGYETAHFRSSTFPLTLPVDGDRIAHQFFRPCSL